MRQFGHKKQFRAHLRSKSRTSVHCLPLPARRERKTGRKRGEEKTIRTKPLLTYSSPRARSRSAPRTNSSDNNTRSPRAAHSGCSAPRRTPRRRTDCAARGSCTPTTPAAAPAGAATPPGRGSSIRSLAPSSAGRRTGTGCMRGGWGVSVANGGFHGPRVRGALGKGALVEMRGNWAGPSRDEVSPETKKLRQTRAARRRVVFSCRPLSGACDRKRTCRNPHIYKR